MSQHDDSVERILSAVLSDHPREAVKALPAREQHAVLLTLGLNARIPTDPGPVRAFDDLSQEEQQIVLRYRDRPPPSRPKGSRRVVIFWGGLAPRIRPL